MTAFLLPATSTAPASTRFWSAIAAIESNKQAKEDQAPTGIVLWERPKTFVEQLCDVCHTVAIWTGVAAVVLLVVVALAIAIAFTVSRDFWIENDMTVKTKAALELSASQFSRWALLALISTVEFVIDAVVFAPANAQRAVSLVKGLSLNALWMTDKSLEVFFQLA